MSDGKIEDSASKDDHLVASLSPPNPESFSKASDTASAIYNKHESRMTEKTTKGRFRRKARVSKKYDQSSSFFLALGAETDNNSSDPWEEIGTSKPEHGSRHHIKKYLSDWLNVIYSVNNRFCKTINYRSYRPANRLSKYDHTVSGNISKMTKCMTAQIKPLTSNRFNPIWVIRFLCNFKLAFDINGSQAGKAMWIFNFFIKKISLFCINSRLASQQKARRRELSKAKTGTLKTYPQVTNYMLRT